MPEQVAVVDADNRFLRWTDRAEGHDRRLPHRSVQVLLFDPAGRLVLQRRHAAKRTYPDHWDISASGHVEAPDYPDLEAPDAGLDAVYDVVAARELEEELGVRCPLTRLGAFGPEPGVHYEHLVLYRGQSDGPFVAQPSEVAEIARFTPEAFDALVGSDDLVTPSVRWFVSWARSHRIW